MGLLRSAATVSSFTLLSRVTGLLRDVLIASSFGAGPLTDAFWVAFRIPNLLRRLFAEGAFSQAFVPVLGEVRNTESMTRVRELLDRVALILTIILMATTVVGILGAPWLLSAIATGMRTAARAEEFQAAVWMTRVMFPYIACMSLVAFASGVLNTWSRFAVPAFTPVLLNVSMIAAALFLSDLFPVPIYALAVGVMIGGLAQLSMQFVALQRLGLLPRYRRPLSTAWHDSTVQHILRQMMPAILGVSVAQLSLLINTNIATWLAPGSVTWLSFADRLMEFPTALLGVALGTVLLPRLSAAYARDEANTYSALLDWGLRLTLLLGLPASAGLALLGDGLVATLFNYGAFSAHDVAQTRLAVTGYSVGLLGLLAVKILAPGFYARQNIRTPVRVALLVLVLTQCLNLILVPLFAHAGLALSIGLGATMNAGFLLWLLLRQGIYQPQRGWLVFFARLLPALCIMGVAVAYLNQQINWLTLGAQPLLRLSYLLGLVLVAVFIYFASLLLFGFRKRDFTRRGV